MSCFIDNNSVLYSLIRGSSAAEDINAVIGHLWRLTDSLGAAFHRMRVESEANPADDPSRGGTQVMSQLGAHFLEPNLPTFLRHIWRIESLAQPTT